MLAPDQNNMRRRINRMLTQSGGAQAWRQGFPAAELACPLRLPVWPSVCAK